jgi:hypothetical protein
MGRRGIKICPSCGTERGARTRICECGHDFKVKSSKKSKPVQSEIAPQETAQEGTTQEQNDEVAVTV